jgi:hypothetical protein
MTSNLSDPQVAYVALQSIGRAIKDLWKPTGTLTVSGPILGGMSVDTYAVGGVTPTSASDPRFGKPPRMWPEVIAVTEALIGSAFAVAQAYLKTLATRPKRADDIDGVANYWKHRDEWGPPWSTGTGSPHANTLAAIGRLGASPPVAPGQLQQLCNAVLLSPAYDPDALWALLA